MNSVNQISQHSKTLKENQKAVVSELAQNILKEITKVAESTKPQQALNLNEVLQLQWA